MRKLLIIAFVFFITALPSYSLENYEDTNSDGRPDRWIKTDSGHVTEISLDQDFDGRVDYIVMYDLSGNKTEEQQDYNFDGIIDDYFYYTRGKMYRRELDSNYDGKIDIWVYLDGIYIEKYEKDTDFDGTVDVVQDYTKEE